MRQDVDPFAAAAWISHVFVTIHPFEVMGLWLAIRVPLTM